METNEVLIRHAGRFSRVRMLIKLIIGLILLLIVCMQYQNVLSFL
ncbi:hypothetical protein [Chitinophaga nivalis]|nr:hypothetical protein [Chitinophaga nivalis]MCW3466300.1 hypothetical protein [Chitinophaga nivalis]